MQGSLDDPVQSCVLLNLDGAGLTAKLLIGFLENSGLEIINGAKIASAAVTAQTQIGLLRCKSNRIQYGSVLIMHKIASQHCALSTFPFSLSLSQTQEKVHPQYILL